MIPKLSVIITLILLLLLPLNNSFASEPVVIISEGEYVMGSGESMEVAYDKAKRAASQKAAEQAGAYVKSYTKVKNLALENDFIEVIANHSMKIEVIEKKKTVLGDVDAIRFYVKIKATMSQEEIENNLKKVMQDQSIVDAYNRLKSDFEKQNKEIERLKRQLELATGGDKQKIAKLISEEEKKYKANLWLERAQQIPWLGTEEKLKAYEKALELNPDLPQAYLGIAKVMEDKYIGEPSSDKEKEDKLDALRDAVESINRAVAIDENYAEAYATRADILYKIKWLDKEGNENDYNEKILKDINRALALNAPNKLELYKLQALISSDRLQNAVSELIKERRFSDSDQELIDDYTKKALMEFEKASSFCDKKDLECLSGFYRLISNNVFYLAHTYFAWCCKEKANNYLEKMKNYEQKAQEIEYQHKEAKEKKLQEEDKELNHTEYGKIEHYLYGEGWAERVTGVSFNEIEAKNEEEKEKIAKQIKSRIEKKIASGSATAEEFLFMSFRVDSPLKEDYFNKGISLLEKRNPQGIDALLIVYLYIYRFVDDDVKISYFKKAKEIVDKNLPHAQKSLSIDESISLASEMGTAKDDDETHANVIKKLGKLTRQQAEAFFWFSFAAQISLQKAEIYEKLDLLQKAREEYLYLCNTFKDQGACKNAERLKK